MIKELQEILDIIWGSDYEYHLQNKLNCLNEPKKKRKQPRDKKGRFVKRII